MCEIKDFWVLIVSVYSTFLIIIIGIIHRALKYILEEIKKEFKKGDNS